MVNCIFYYITVIKAELMYTKYFKTLNLILIYERENKLIYYFYERKTKIKNNNYNN